jgi:hypothetical protein
MVYPPRGTIIHAFEVRDVYKAHRPSPFARLELVLAQYALCLIDAIEDTILALPMGDRGAHFIVSGKAPLHTALHNYTPTVNRQLFKRGLDCRIVELSNFADFIIPQTDHMAIALIDSLNYHMNIGKGMSGLHDLHSSLTTPRIDDPGFPTQAALSTDGPDGVGAIATGNEAATFTDTRKVVISLTSPSPSYTPKLFRK